MKKPSMKLKNLDITSIMTTIDNYDYDLMDADRLYDEIRDASDPDNTIATTLDDLILVSMGLAFIEGMKFQKKLGEILSIKYE